MSAAPDLPKRRDFIGIFYGPWVAGMRTEGWGGPMLAEVTISDSPIETRGERFALAVEALTEKMETECAKRAMNAIVGAEFNLDPWAENKDGEMVLRLWAVGTCALLAPLFPAPIPAPDLFPEVLP